MRVLTFAALSATLLAAPALQAATKHARASRAAPMGALSCVFDQDRSAFDIEGLKSQMMVTAITCHNQDKYNAFLERYRPEVADAEQILQGYFKRSYGKAGAKNYDEYMTQLADNQEQVTLKAGTAYCENLNEMYDEVMSLHDGTELHDYSNAKQLYQPATFETCAGTPPPAASTHRTKHSGKARKA